MNKKNTEGYSDPTVYAAFSKLEQEEQQAKKLKATLTQVCDVAGYILKGRISLVDKKTGEIYTL